MNSVAAIILAFNETRDTIEAVNSLFSSSLPPTLCFILDNGSTEGDVYHVISEAFKDDVSCVVLRSEVNLGFSSGVNVCIRRARQLNPDYFLLMNNDATVSTSCIQELVDSLNHDPDALVCGPSIYYSSDPDILWQGAGHFSKLKATVTIPNMKKPYFPEERIAYSTGFISGCVMLLKSSVIDKVGLFDEKYFFYCEDMDYCLRVIEAGYRILYLPATRAIHKIDLSFSNRASAFVFYHLARSKMRLIRKHYGILYQSYAILLHWTLGTLVRIKQILGNHSNVRILLAWFEGLVDGVFRKNAPRRY